MLIDNHFDVIDSWITGLDDEYMTLILADEGHYNLVVIDKENGLMMSTIVDGRIDDIKTKEAAGKIVKLIEEYREDN